MIEITVTNPDGLTVCPVLIERPEFDEYLDKPRRLVAKIEKGSGLDAQGTVRVDMRGKIILLGHIKQFDQSRQEYDRLVLDSAEALLAERIGQFYRYPAGTMLNSMLASEMGGSVVGLLAMANGLIPRGAWKPLSGAWYWIEGGGSSGRFGPITTLYQDHRPLTKVIDWPASPAGSFYQDASNLAIRCFDDRSPDYHLIIAPNFKDTLVRLGTISTGTTTFAVCYEVGANVIFPSIKALVLAGGLEWTIRYEKDGHAYLDALVSVGKGTSSEPVAAYIEGKNAEVTINQMDGLGKLQALLGQGAGSGMTQQCSAALDLTTQGVWREGVYRSGGLFGSMLEAATEKVFSDCQDPTIYRIRAMDQDWSQAVGNYVAVHRAGHQPLYKRIKHVQQRPAGDMILEVGQRLRTLAELLRAGEEVQNILSSFYGSHTKNAWSWSIPETNIDSYESISHQFLLASTDDSIKPSDDKTIGSGEIDPNFPFMVLLNLKIGWYTSSILSSRTPTTSHSNVGSHGGYGGGQTSSNPMTAHSVPQQTGVAGSPSTTVGTGVYTSLGGSHGHSVSTTTTNTWGGGSPSHTHGYSLAYAVSSHGGHQHSIGYASTVAVASNTHTHIMPGHYTNEAGAQSHTEQVKSANARAGSSAHPEADAILEGLKKKYGTGNSVHYLTLDILVNGIRVPGAPFSGEGGAGLYVGDSLDNIDISSLVTVGVRNTIEIILTEFGGPGPVRCSVSGNINVNAVISAF
ncbi:MAG: hypothetical protein WC343_12235 [Bacilli bacterium]|jgi:hypothetical protein